MQEWRDDAALAEAYLEEKDEQALKELFSRHAGAIYAFLARFMGDEAAAEDAAQETFIKAWKHLRRYDRARPFRAWLYAIARRTALDAIKKRGLVPASSFEREDGSYGLLDEIEDSAPLPSEALDAQTDREKTGQRLQSALSRLSPADRDALSLRFSEDMSFKEIGEALGKPLDTVKSRIRRALISLKGFLSEQDDAPKPDRAS